MPRSGRRKVEQLFEASRDVWALKGLYFTDPASMRERARCSKDPKERARFHAREAKSAAWDKWFAEEQRKLTFG